MVSIIGLDSAMVQQLCDAANEEVDEANKVQISNFLCTELKQLKQMQNHLRLEWRGAVSCSWCFPHWFYETYCVKTRNHIGSNSNQNPRIPVISNVDVKPHADPGRIKKILARQVTSPVQWETTVKTLLDRGLRKSYELGPGKVISSIVKRMDKGADIENIDA